MHILSHLEEKLVCIITRQGRGERNYLAMVERDRILRMISALLLQY